MQAVKPPGSPSSKAHRAPGSLLVHLHSGQGTPGHSGKLPPKGPGRVLPEKKFGGVNVGSRNSVLDVAGRVLPLSDFGPSADLELPRGPRATPSSQRGLEVRRARRPRKTRADPPPPSLEFAAKSDGGVHPSNSVQGKPSTSGPRRPPADGNYIAGRGGLLCAKPQSDSTASPLFIPSTWPEPMGQPRAL